MIRLFAGFDQKMIQGVLTSVAVLLRIISNPLGNVFQKQLIGRGSHPLFVNFLTYLLLSLPCLLIALTINWKELPAEFWWYSLLAGALGAFGNGFLVKALEKGDLSVLGPINSYKSVIGMIAGMFLLGEIPGIAGLAGILLIIFGSYFILDTTEDRFSWKLLKRAEIQFRLLAMVLTATEAVFVKKIILSSSTTIACMSWCCFGTLFSWLFLRLNGIDAGKALRNVRQADFGKWAFLVICVGTVLISTIYTFVHMQVSYGLSLFQLSTIASVLLGYRFFDEKDVGKKLLGSVIMIFGSIVLILFNDL